MLKDFGKAEFIWLPQDRYENCVYSKKTNNAPMGQTEFCVAEFKKTFHLDKEPKGARLHIFADTRYRLYVNSAYAGTGPVNNGGDFITLESLPLCYYSSYDICLCEGGNELFVEVSLSPVVDTETSQGRGGLILALAMDFDDGSKQMIFTDSSWLCRKKTSKPFANWLDTLRKEDDFVNAEEISGIWTLAQSPIPNLQESFVPYTRIHVSDEYRDRLSEHEGKIVLKNGCPLTFTLEFDMIYAGYCSFAFEGGSVALQIGFQEILGKTNKEERLWLKGEYDYRGFGLASIGYMQITVSFCDYDDCVFEGAGLIYSRYPVETELGHFVCDDEELNRINKVSRHTVEICRQHLHLDSPLHQELLSCTADYFVQNMVEYFTFGDHRLTRFDIVRTCDLLKFTGGLAFHTTYSLILLQQIAAYYKYTGDKTLLYEIDEGLEVLLDRFATYEREDGILQTAPSYMFIDWIVVDGIDLHHPPKALGQTVLNAFYYKALLDMAYLCGEMCESDRAAAYSDNGEKQLYFDGLNDDEPENGKWRPENVQKRYHTKNSNVLAVLYGIAPKERRKELLKRALHLESAPRMSPYFTYYALEAIYNEGLFGKYGLSEIRTWSEILAESDKGLKEVWTGFDCDYSHGWGGSPAYFLPAKMLGLEILEPGFKKISLKPDLLGLEWADIKVPTPYGFINARLERGREPEISLPAGIELAK